MSGPIDESTSGLPSAAPQSAAPQFFHRPDLHARPEDGDDDVQPRRRKVRKGTHTCWECKRRKVRCTFSAPGDATCQVCARRCLRCVSQEFPEETTPAELQSRLVGDRLVQVEEMVRHLARQGMRTPQAEPLSSSSSSTPPALVPNSMLTPANSTTPASSVCCESLSSLPLETRDASASIFASTPTILTILPGASHEELAGALLTAFPSGPDLDLIASCTAEAYNHCQVLFRSQRDIRDSGFWPTTGLRARPMKLSSSPLPHPVIIARQMLLLAVVLQLSDSRARKGLGGLSEPASTIAARLGSTAIGLVTRNDELLDTLDNSVDSSPDGLEGLECIILEAMYRGNSGQLRRSWLTWRRGISLAQLMRLPSMASRPASASSSPVCPLDSSSSSSSSSSSHSFPPPYPPVNPQFLWYRMLTTERFLCLLLGLPQTTVDTPIPSVETLGNDTPMGRLEHQLGRITMYVLDRNQRGPRPDDYAATQRIDREMQTIAATLPARWWLPPNLAASSIPSSSSVSSPPSSSPSSPTSDVWEMMRLIYQAFYYNLLNQLHLPYMMRRPEDDHHNQYSRIACVSASREVLVRYVALRTYNNIACCCRFAEFFALMASLTLLLVHIDGHGHSNDNLFTHQRLSDRAMTEEAVENMARVGRLNGDVVSQSSVDLVRQLLAIEADAAASGPHCSLASCADDVQTAGHLCISVPYVGLITIASNGAITKEAHPHPPPPVRPSTTSAPSPSLPHTRAHFGSSLLPPLAADSSHGFAPDPQSASRAPSIPLQTPCPGPTAGTDQWAFQGVDMAFFDTLMRQADLPAQTPTSGYSLSSHTW